MRAAPSIENSINTPRNHNMTVYEMASSMSDTYDAQEGIPYLIKWLFKDFFVHYKYNNIPYSDEYAYNISYFLVYNFLNREICSKKPEVFRSKLLKELVNMNLDADFYNVLMDLKNSNATLSKDTKTKEDNTYNSESTTSNNLKTTSTSSEVETGKDITTYNSDDNKIVEDNKTLNSVTDSTTTYDYTSTETNDLSTNENNNSTSKETVNSVNNTSTDSNVDNKGRTVNTDYPQSTVNTTVTGSWEYASGAQDTLNNTTSSETTESSNDSTTDNTLSTTNIIKNTGTVKNESLNNQDYNSENTDTETRSISDKTTKRGEDTLDSNKKSDISSETLNTGDVNNTSNSSDNKNVDINEVWTNMSGFELSMNQIDIYDKYNSFYRKLMNRFENCFISLYVDEDRDGWLDPSINLMIAWT